MTAIHVEVTAELIAEFPDVRKHWDGPVNAALRMLTDQDVDIDGDGQDGYVATIGQDAWTLVIDLPEAAADFLDYRWEGGGPGDPFAFDIEVPEWIVVLVARAASTEEQGDAVLRADGLA